MLPDILTPAARGALQKLLWVSLLIGVILFFILVFMSAGMNELSSINRDFRLPLFYFLAIGMMLLVDRWHRLINTGMTIEIITNINTRISNALFNISYEDYEALDKDQILSIVSEDSRLTSDGIDSAARFILLFILQIAELIYLGFLSPLIFTISLVFMASVYIIVFLVLRRIARIEEGVTDLEAQVHGGLRGQISGFKELAINRRKRSEHYQTEIVQPTQQMALAKQKEKFFLSLLFVMSDVALLLFAGLFIIILPMFEVDVGEVAARGGLIILFFPIALFMELPNVSRAALALGRLARTLRTLEELAARNRADDSAADAPALLPTQPFSIRCDCVTYRYPGIEDEDGFSFGPASFAIEPGTINFLVGGNGSGKSTCLKVLIGLYRPNGGKVFLNETPVDMSRYRHAFSTVFVESYLFGRIYGVDHVDDDKVNGMLDDWGIGAKTRFLNGRFTRTALSTGQKKRAIMVGALLENKPVLVLDEWAADQDPEFRIWFYREFLPEIRAKGKTVIMVTHDDRFFDVADQVLHFDYGRLRQTDRKATVPDNESDD